MIKLSSTVWKLKKQKIVDFKWLHGRYLAHIANTKSQVACVPIHHILSITVEVMKGSSLKDWDSYITKEYKNKTCTNPNHKKNTYYYWAQKSYRKIES